MASIDIKNESAAPYSQHQPETLVMSRFPIWLSVLLAVLKAFSVPPFKSFPWEWTLFPWWFALYYLQVYNLSSLLGETRLPLLAILLVVLSGLLTVVRLSFDIPPLTNHGWWVIFIPMWTLTALCSLRLLGMRLSSTIYQPTKWVWLIIGAIVVGKWLGIGFFAAWSWQWIVVFFALVCGFDFLFNVVEMGGARYLVPAHVIVLVTVPIAVRQALISTRFDLTWALIFTPALLYSAFCSIIVWPNLNNLRKRMLRRNTAIEQRQEKGEIDAPVPLEPEMVAMPLPGADPRFRLLPLMILPAVAMPLQYCVGFLGGWLVGRLAAWLSDHLPSFIASGIVVLALTLYYYWIYLLAASLAIAWFAQRCHCGHRPTLWTVTILACGAAFTGFIQGFFPTGFEPSHGLGIIGDGFMVVFIFAFLITAQGGALGLVRIITPREQLQRSQNERNESDT
jgi:hypothetical protein